MWKILSFILFSDGKLKHKVFKWLSKIVQLVNINWDVSQVVWFPSPQFFPFLLLPWDVIIFSNFVSSYLSLFSIDYPCSLFLFFTCKFYFISSWLQYLKFTSVLGSRCLFISVLFFTHSLPQHWGTVSLLVLL